MQAAAAARPLLHASVHFRTEALGSTMRFCCRQKLLPARTHGSATTHARQYALRILIDQVLHLSA
jgi:hypothetical protein